MANPVILSSVKKTSIYFRDILGETRRGGNENLTPIRSLPWENRSICNNLHMCSELLSSPSHSCTEVRASHRLLCTLAESHQGRIRPCSPSFTHCSCWITASQSVRLHSEGWAGKKDLSSDKLPDVCSREHSLVLPLPFCLPPNLLHWTLAQYCLLFLEREWGFYTIFSAAIPFNLLLMAFEILDWGLCF